MDIKSGASLLDTYLEEAVLGVRSSATVPVVSKLLRFGTVFSFSGVKQVSATFKSEFARYVDLRDVGVKNYLA